MKKLLHFTSVLICTLLLCLYIAPDNVNANASVIEQKCIPMLQKPDITLAREMTLRSSSGVNGGGNTPREYVITFNANYGTINGSSRLTTTDQRLSSLPSASRPGYTFKGWYTQSVGGTLITTSTVFSYNTDVYAQWDTYDAYFRNFFISDISDTTVSIMALIQNTYVSTWGISFGTSSNYLSESRVMNQYSVSSALTMTLSGLTPNTTYFYKVYFIADNMRVESRVGSFTTARTAEYSVTFYANGGTVNGQSTLMTVNQMLPYLPGAYRDGYHFDGWFTEPYDGNLITANTVFRSNSTLYAHWTYQDTSNPSVTPPTTGGSNNGSSNNTNTGNSGSYEEEENDEPISVQRIKLKSLKNIKVRKIKVKWNWYAYGDGYQIAYSTNKNFAASKTKRINAGVFTDAKTIAGLQRGKTYYVKVRAFQKSGGKKYYGAWSNVKKIKVKI